MAFGGDLGLKPTSAQPIKSCAAGCGHSEEGLSVSTFFCLCRAACGILVPRPGIEPRPSAVKALSPNQWTTREVPFLVGGGGFQFLICPEMLRRLPVAPDRQKLWTGMGCPGLDDTAEPGQGISG